MEKFTKEEFIEIVKKLDEDRNYRKTAEFTDFCKKYKTFIFSSEFAEMREEILKEINCKEIK